MLGKVLTGKNMEFHNWTVLLKYNYVEIVMFCILKADSLKSSYDEWTWLWL